MPVQVSYPGVYVEEIPSGVRTITGVATSIAAFVGWAPQGLTGTAQLVLSWAEYVRQYGGLDSRGLLGYAVSQFFTNGGSVAYIVRLVADDANPATISLAAADGNGSLVITAENPGLWGNSYGIFIKNQLDASSKSTGRFRLQVAYAPPGTPTPPPVVVESFENLSITTPDPKGRYVVDIVNNQSNYITVSVSLTDPTKPLTLPPADIPKSPATAPQNLQKGQDGTVLTPSTDSGKPGAFETALTPTSGSGGIYLLDHVDLFNLLCVPGEIVGSTLSTLEQYCEGAIGGHPPLRAFLIADSNPNIIDYTKLTTGPPISGKNAAFYFPWINAPDPLKPGVTSVYPPCGFVAGIYARTDGNRGVWKAPAGTEATLTGVIGPAVPLNDPENG